MSDAKSKRVTKRQSAAVRSFAHQLKTIRHERGLSQLQLAVKANIHLSYLGRVERGESAPSLDTIIHFANALGVSAAELISPDRKAEPPIMALRAQVRENVGAVLKTADPVVLQTLAVVAAALARTR
jgi:transcriptional regulator with XRE-family HTH domain